MSIYDYKQRNLVVVVLLFALGLTVLYSVREVLGALLSTVVMYVIFRPLVLFLIHKWHWQRWLAAIFVIFFSLVIIVLPLFTFCMMVIHKISQLNNTTEIKQFTTQLNVFLGANFRLHHLIESMSVRAELFVSELLPVFLSGIINTLLGLVVMYFVLYFMFVQQKEFEAAMLKYVPFKENNTLIFARELQNITYSNVLGQGLIALTQGILVGIGFYIFNIKDPVFWATIAFFVSFLPVIGTPIIFVPAAIIELLNGNQTAGWGLLLWGFLVIINIENIIRLLIAKRLANIHPIITVIGVIIGIPVFGILGVVFGPLLLSYFILTVRMYEKNVIVSKRLERIKSAKRV